MSSVTADDGAEICYRDWRTEGSPVLLSHGWPLNSDAGEAAAVFLAVRGHRVIAHDRRGHRRSSQTWHGNEMDTYADDLATLIEALDLRALTLVGHSTGGGEIVRYLGRHGSAREARLVLVAAVPPLVLRTDDNPEGLLRENPQIIADLTVAEMLDHLTTVIESVDIPPLIMGHSFGGTLTRLLLARRLGSAGVVMDSAPTEGVRVNPISQARSLFPALKNPANRHRAVGFTPEEFPHAFTNTLTEEESKKVRDRYAIAAPGFWVWEYGLFANFKPGHQDTWVDYSADRAPLLFIGGEHDHIMPPWVNKSNARHYPKSPALTEYIECAGRDHGTCAAPGWEVVADHALEWGWRTPARTGPGHRAAERRDRRLTRMRSAPRTWCCSAMIITPTISTTAAGRCSHGRDGPDHVVRRPPVGRRQRARAAGRRADGAAHRR